MDILDIIINIFKLTDSIELLQKNWTIFTDKNEYPGERIKSFTLLILTYLFLLIGIIYLILKLINK